MRGGVSAALGSGDLSQRPGSPRAAEVLWLVRYPQGELVEVVHKEQIGNVGTMSATKVDLLVERAMMLGTDASDDDASIEELRGLAQGDESALERAMQVSLAQQVSLAARHRAIELLARARYEDRSLPSPTP
jgi:hypothetical protein